MFLKPVTSHDADDVRYKLISKRPFTHHASAIGYDDFVARYESQHQQPPVNELYVLAPVKRYRITRFMLHEALYCHEDVISLCQCIGARIQDEGLYYLNQQKELSFLTGVFLVHQSNATRVYCSLENETSLYSGTLQHAQSLLVVERAPKLITAPISSSACESDDTRVYNDLILFNSRQLKYQGMNLSYQLVSAYIGIKSYTEIGILKRYL